MNNKGFTLIELLAVILILIAISAVSVSSVSSSLKRNDEKECERQAEIIKNSAKVYFSTRNTNTVTVQELISNGYVESKNVDKYSNAYVELGESITIHYQGTGTCNTTN